MNQVSGIGASLYHVHMTYRCTFDSSLGLLSFYYSKLMPTIPILKRNWLFDTGITGRSLLWHYGLPEGRIPYVARSLATFIGPPSRIFFNPVR